jgi:hypothetical protein
MAVDEDEKEIPQEEELVEETEAVDEVEDKDMEQEEDWIDPLKQIHFVIKNYFDELVITSDGVNYLQKFNSHR